MIYVFGCDMYSAKLTMYEFDELSADKSMYDDAEGLISLIL